MENQAKDFVNNISPAVVQVHLLGNFNIRRRGENLLLPDTSDARHLLAYLLLNKQQIHTRSVLLGLFWQELDETRARRALSQAIWHIRRRFPKLLESSTETIGISSQVEVWSDVEAFKALTEEPVRQKLLVTHQNLSQAVEYYKGDLLEGFYDDWVLLEREYLRERYLQALEQLIQIEKSEGNYPRALELAMRLVSTDKLRESAHREIMQLYYLLNRPNAAIMQFETYSQLLLDELGLEPTSETLALAQEILKQTKGDSPPYLPKIAYRTKPVSLDRQYARSVMLVGREEDRALLVGFVEETFKHRGGVILVEGEAGIGKTRLMREVARDAEWRGAQVLWGYAVEAGISSAFALLMNAIDDKLTGLRVQQLAEFVKPLHLQVLKPFIPKIAARFPEMPSAPPLEPEREKSRLAEAVMDFLSNWTGINPLVIILEDLHWADEDSLNLLSMLTSRTQKQGILFIGTYRGEEARSSTGVWKQLQKIDRAGVLKRLTLSPLAEVPSSELIQRCLNLDRAAPAFERRIYQETNGNPLFILETLHTLQEEGLLRKDEKGNWQTPWDTITVDYTELPLPSVVEDVIARRFTFLSFPARQVLNAAAVLNAQSDFTLLSLVSNLKPKSFLIAARELVDRNLFEELADGYRFSHDKIRQVARAALKKEQQIALHRQVVQIVEEHAPEMLELLAHHASEGHLWEKALKYHRQAAFEAEKVSAYASALGHYDQAIEALQFIDVAASVEFDVRSSREKMLGILGKREAQEKELEILQAIAGDDPLMLYLVYLRRAKYLALISNYEKSRALIQRALVIAQEQHDKVREAEALQVLGDALIFQGKTEESIVYLQQAVKIVQALGETMTEIQCRCSLASAFTGIREYDHAEKELELALEQAIKQNKILEQAEIFNLLGIIDMERGASDSAQAQYEKSLKCCRAIGFLYGEGRELVNLGNLFYFRGQVARTLELYEQAIKVFESLGEKRGEVQLRLNRASISLNMLGGKEKIKEDALFALRYAEEVGDPLSRGQALTVMSEVERQRGNLIEARKLIEEGIAVIQSAGDQWLLAQEYRALGQLDIDEGNPSQALLDLEHALIICDELGMTNLKPPLIALRGVALKMEGKYSEALEAVSEAMLLIKPDIEQVYLIPYWYAEVLEAMERYEEAAIAVQKSYELLQQAVSGLSPQQREESLMQVAEHRAIVDMWQSRQAQRIEVRLQKAEAEQAEYVVVQWTIDAPADAKVQGKVARRRHRILRLLKEADQQGGIPTHQALADALGVGLRTIERDMAAINR